MILNKFKLLLQWVMMGLLGVLTMAHAESWPTKPITLVVPFAAGGATDNTARLLAKELTQALGQPVVVDNKPGAAGSLGAGFVARAKPDGYTLLIGTNSTHGTTPAVQKVSYSPTQDFSPIAVVGSAPTLLLISPSSQFSSLGDLVQRAKKEPGRLTYASSGQGSIIHLLSLQMALAAGIEMVHVPYKSATASYQDVASGRVDMVLDYAGVALPQVRGGMLKAIGISSSKPLDSAPGVPTFTQGGVPFVADVWVGLFAPRGTPDAIVNRLNEEVRKATQGKSVQENFSANATAAGTDSVTEFKARVKAESERWRDIAKARNITID